MQDTLKLIKALADGNRLRIVAALTRHEELCACQIIELLEVSGATISRHLGILQDADLVNSRKDGRWVYYCLNRPAGSAPLFEWIEQEIANTKAWKKDVRTLKNITSVSPEDLCRKQRGEECCPA